MNRLLSIMWVTVALLLACFGNVCAGEVSVVRTYNPSLLSLTTIDAQDGNAYLLPEYPVMTCIGEPGEPNLPYDIFNVIIPTYCNNLQVSVGEYTIKTDSVLNTTVMPVQSPGIVGETESPEFIPPRPAQESSCDINCRILSEGFAIGNLHMVTVALCPIKYDAENRRLSMANDVTVHVRYDTCGESEMNGTPIIPKNDNLSIRKKITAMSANSSGLAVCTTAAMATDNEPTLDENFIAENYYIIVPAKLKGAVDKLAVWKRQKGYEVTVKTIESICSTPEYRIGEQFKFGDNLQQIVDSAASLRAYLHDEFSANGAFYCLLIGDYRTSMPIRRVRKSDITSEYSKNPNGSNFIPTDNYFSDLTTKWTLTKPAGHTVFSALYNSVPFYPEIVVGRLLCHTAEEISNYTEKLIIYESNPGLGDADYLNQALYFEHDGTQNNNKANLVGFSKFARDAFYPYENVIVAQDIDSVPQPYGHYGHHIIEYMSASGYTSGYGHGSPTSIGTCTWQYKIVPDSRYTPDQLNLTILDRDKACGYNDLNNFGRPGVFYSIACTATPFDAYTDEATDPTTGTKINGHVFNMPYNMGSGYTVAGLYGGVAYLGNTREGWVRGDGTNPILALSPLLEVKFGQCILGANKVGLAEAMSKTAFPAYSVLAAHNLIGDPEFELWFGKPSCLSQTTLLRNQIYYCRTDSVADVNLYIDCFEQTSYNRRISFGPYTISMLAPPCDFVASFWKSDFLPHLEYHAACGTLQDTHEAIVTTAELGSDIEELPFTIGNGGLLNLTVFTNTTIRPGLHVMESGKLNISCDGSCAITGAHIMNDGEMSVKADQVTLGAGFTIEKGGVFRISKN